MEPATVLIADDDDALLGLMLRRIQRMNLRADSAQDGSRAAAMLEQGEYHLLITDINMPGRSGLELLEQAKSRDPNLQVVIVTGGATLETAIQAVNNGAFAYLTKPFDHISVLENTAFRALEYRRLRIENQRMAEIWSTAVCGSRTSAWPRSSADAAICWSRRLPTACCRSAGKIARCARSWLSSPKAS